MYIHKLVVKNIRSIESFEMEFDPGEYAGWHVVIGDNGAGKSTFVRSLALSIAGPNEAAGLRQSWNEWLRQDQTHGSILLQVVRDSKFDKATGRGRQINGPIDAQLDFRKSGSDVEISAPKQCPARRFLWGNGPGWFTSSFGPYRRFTGGDKNFEKLYYSSPRLAPHLSAFGEDVALTEVVEWLKLLHIRSLEEHAEDQRTLDNMRRLINEGELLPHGMKLKSISSDGVVFKDGNGNTIGVNQLSDGYRSVLSMTFEIIRQLVKTYGSKAVFSKLRKDELVLDVPGVVAIDEVDAHLHPSWQKRIGPWFCRVFPRMQFLVTTHSPLVCQASVKGSVWKLPSPGQSEGGGRISGNDLQKLLFGDLVEAYDTNLFGIQSTRSEVGKEKLERLAKLNVQARRGALATAEKRELQELRASLPTMAAIE